MNTREDLIALVLQNLGVLASGQSPSAEDRETVNLRVDRKLSELGRREIFVGLDADKLDDAVFLYVADILTFACTSPFGIAGAKRDELGKVAAEAEAMLKGMARQFEPTAASAAFDIVQSVLEALNVVSPGQKPSDQDRGVVLARVTPMLADLRAREITTFLVLSDADPAMLPHLAAILLARCASSFGADAATQAALGQAAGAAEVALNAMVRQFDTGSATSGSFDLIQVVLENLGAVAVGRTASGKDRLIIGARVDAVIADLRRREVIDIPSLGDADSGTLLQLSVVLTSACAMAWGLPADVRQALKAEAVLAENALRLIARQLDTGTATSTVFDPIQAVLEMLGVVSAGQTASDKDRAVVAARVQPKLLELRGREICGVTDLSLLTPELQGAFVRLLAAECALAFPSVAPARLALLTGMVPEAERILRRQSFVYDARPPMRAERFWGRRTGGFAASGPALGFAPPPDTITVILDGGEL